MRRIFGQMGALAGVVVLGACGGGGDGGGDGHGACSGIDEALVGSCLLLDGTCHEYRGGISATSAEEDCAATSGTATFTAGGCDESAKLNGGCASSFDGGTFVLYDPTSTEADLESLCEEFGDCYFGDGGTDGTGGTGGGDHCTEPEPGATLGGSCEFMGFCYEVRGGLSTSQWRTGCLDPQVGGVWSDGACAEAYKASGACMTGIFGTTVTYYYGDLGASYVEAACADTPCGEYVAP